jgi:hypothetical protein
VTGVFSFLAFNYRILSMSGGPEARKRLEKERPGLVAARDQAVVEQKGNGSSKS